MLTMVEFPTNPPTPNPIKTEKKKRTKTTQQMLFLKHVCGVKGYFFTKHFFSYKNMLTIWTCQNLR